MTDLQLCTQLWALPDDLKKQVQDFIEFLKAKTQKQRPLKQLKFGAAKGFLMCVMTLMSL